MRRFHRAPAALIPLLALTTGCDDMEDPTAAPGRAVEDAAHSEAALVPSPLASVSLAGSELLLWPYTGTDVQGTASDPINLIFPGVAPLGVRAALLRLDGDRSAFGFPPVAPFDCAWKDAVGANQSSYSDAAGWQGSVIQLECGDYGPVRFHVRMFPAGGSTVANAHFEVQVPGTNRHEVLSWELAEQLLVADLARSGLLGAPPAQTAPITPAPTYRAINPLVYNGLPAPLKAAIGGPQAPQSDPIPMPNDGRATILRLASTPPIQPMNERRVTVLEFDQVIPRPFCSAGPLDYLYVRGPIDFALQVVVTPSGEYRSDFHATGRLELLPVDPRTTPPSPVGEAFAAQVVAHYSSVITGGGAFVSDTETQTMIPQDGADRGQMSRSLRVGSGPDRSSTHIRCD